MSSTPTLPPVVSSSSNAAASSSSSKSNSAQSHSTPRPSTPSASSSSSSTKTPDLSKILSPDGKLLPEERERRRKNNLCIICGLKEHFADKCPSSKNKTQERSACLEEIPEGNASEGSVSEAESSELSN